MLKIQVLPGFEEDLVKLPDPETVNIARGWIRQLACQNPIAKKPLGVFKKVGDLTGTWAIKFDQPGFHNRFRLIFKYLPGDEKPTTVLLIAVGLRFEYQVYNIAVSRLRLAILP